MLVKFLDLIPNKFFQYNLNFRDEVLYEKNIDK